MATAPAFTATPNNQFTQIPATANTSLTGSGTITNVWTAGASGGIVYEVRVKPIAAITVAGMVRLFLSSDNGTTWRLFDEFAIAVDTIGANNMAQEYARTYSNLLLNAGTGGTTNTIGASTEKADIFNIFVFGGNY